MRSAHYKDLGICVTHVRNMRKKNSCNKETSTNLRFFSIRTVLKGKEFISSKIVATLQENKSTLVISNSKGPSEILRNIRISTYQICRIEEKR